MRTTTSQDLQRRVQNLTGAKVCIIGDLMLDEYLVGDAERISPEAPVPVVHVSEERTVLGGAGNVARNVHALGGKVHLAGIAGKDKSGDLLQDLLQAEGIASSVLRLDGRPTTVKTRVLARQQQMLRIDRENPRPCKATESRDLLAMVEPLLDAYPVLVLSDYGKGVITKDFLQGLHDLCKRSGKPPLVLVDPKTPNFHLYTGMYLLTPNSKETSEGSGLPVSSHDEILAAGRRIFERLGCSHLLTTLGPQGMALFLDPETVWHIPTVARKVFDVTGAGDTVIATIALGLAGSLPLLDACMLANFAAGHVVGQVGAAAVDQEALRASIEQMGLPAIERW